MSVKEFVYETVAKAFGKTTDEINDGLNLLEDLQAKSVNYFPIMNALEEEYDLDLQYQTFRDECRSVGQIVEMVEAEV